MLVRSDQNIIPKAHIKKVAHIFCSTSIWTNLLPCGLAAILFSHGLRKHVSCIQKCLLHTELSLTYKQMVCIETVFSSFWSRTTRMTKFSLIEPRKKTNVKNNNLYIWCSFSHPETESEIPLSCLWFIYLKIGHFSHIPKVWLRIICWLF